eukprot:2297892-Pleurochrysis_carterae.AAC.2
MAWESSASCRQTAVLRVDCCATRLARARALTPSGRACRRRKRMVFVFAFLRSRIPNEDLLLLLDRAHPCAALARACGPNSFR